MLKPPLGENWSSFGGRCLPHILSKLKRDLHATCLLSWKRSLPRPQKPWHCATSPLSFHALFGYKESCKTFPVQEPIACTVYDSWVTPERFSLSPKIFAELLSGKCLQRNGISLWLILPILISNKLLHPKVFLSKISLFQRFCRWKIWDSPEGSLILQPSPATSSRCSFNVSNCS